MNARRVATEHPMFYIKFDNEVARRSLPAIKALSKNTMAADATKRGKEAARKIQDHD